MRLEGRFWSKVDRDEDDECWPWTSVRHPEGYGKIKVGGRFEYAHRVAMRLEGHDVDGGLVLHECDNPACVNPSHLYLGDQSDNVQDMWDRDRHPPNEAPETPSGDENPNSKLSRADVEEIRERLADGEVQSSIASEFGVARSSVSHISTGKRWSDDE